MPKHKRAYMAHLMFTFNVPIEATSQEVAERLAGRMTVSTAYERMTSVNYHHYTVCAADATEESTTPQGDDAR
ncbi:MAG: hypothetical protein ACREMY_02325 [bacterium]